jgi:hypothetical protein
MLKVEVQMVEEKKYKKKLAEWLKWPKTENSNKISKNTQNV